MTDLDLVKMAITARENSYSPYSNFMVGAAIVADSGKVYTGANVENAAYSPTICAERSAIGTAVSAGERRFTKVAVAGWPKDGSGHATPCGVCRQTLMEFCQQDTQILIAYGGDVYQTYTLAELLPLGFGPDSL